MALTDLPQIDKCSVYSERSENALKAYLNQGNGLILRADVPDKGCDFDAELITGGSNASNQRFGIQVKSIEKLKLVANGKFISYSFETSRLNYLLNRPIGTGLMILYDVENHVCYYDMADQIHNRLVDERPNDDWRMKDAVNIRVPVENRLTHETALKIHQVFAERFDKAAFILSSYGQKYNYPVLKQTGKFKYDFNNPDHVKKLLIEHGFSFMHSHDMYFLYNLIAQVPNRDIIRSTDLLIIAAIAYGEAGKHADSEFYIRKLARHGDVPDEHRELIAFSHLKNQLSLNEITITEFLNGARELKKQVGASYNEILLEINITFYELGGIKYLQDVPEHLEQSIREVFIKINNLSADPKTKQLLEVWNAENFAQLIAYHRQRQLNELAIRRAMGINTISQAQKKKDELLKKMQAELNSGLERLFNTAEKTEDNLLKAHTIYLRTRYIFVQEIDVISQMPLLADIRFHDEALFLNHIKLSLSAADLFRDLSYFQYAYQSLCYGLELIDLGRNFYGYHDGMDRDRLLVIKQSMEHELDVDEYEFQIPLLTSQRDAKQQEFETHPMLMVVNLDDLQLENLAATFMHALDIPGDCRLNVIGELSAYHLFYKRCKHPDIEVKQPFRMPIHPSLYYQQPVKFILKNKTTGIQSVISESMDHLLTSWGY
ncbi:protein of unknown function [Mucilaginibacter gossypiicola]|uniref:DUF4365 domain-containing protein n=1 Tax=Mucilaginibacter gossypiicola TaxID=551995 RepID=A0A1H8LV06_9SPHI|nr:DUF4365 domain-containing protein [Mucilaginibacter gossypiicola]SEO08947.1 protein of unknown function [Mucilaginibacter gossypiicola]